MNVLLIGGMSSLINQLIRKIKKEGHRVYLLTGSRFSPAGYEKVFVRYDLPYDSESLTDAFESVNPDVTLFMGAFDSNFRWANEDRDLVRLTSSLTNLLTSHSMTGKGRFIFLSSDAVYSENSGTDVAEDAPMSPSDTLGMALAQCEDICESFRRLRNADIAVLRVDHFYTIPKKPDEVNDVCSRMCLEALKNGKIPADSGKRFSMLYESDAVEFIFQLIRCGEHRYPVYHLSSSKELTELELARYIRKAMSEDTGVAIEKKEGAVRRRVLSNRRYDDEFGAKIFADTQETVGKVAQYMAAHKELFLTGEEEKESLWKRIMNRLGWLGRALVPYLENIVCFILFFLLSSSAIASRYLNRLDLYLLYVLLFAVVYGQTQATVSAVLAVIGTYFTQLADRTFLEITLDYNTYLWIAQLFIVGLVVGYIKDQILKLKMEREEERQFLTLQLTDIKDINGSNVRVKDALETEIVNQRDSIGKVYHVTSKLDQYMPEDVLFYAAEILGELLESGDIAIYTVSSDTYARLFAFTSEKAKSLGKSLRYREMGEVYDTLAGRKVYINRSLDEKYPMMADAIFGDDGKMRLVIMVWGIPWERMTLGQADLLTVVSYLIQNAVLRAARQIEQMENERYLDDGFVMEQEAFSSLVRAFLTARSKGLTECTVLKVTPPAGELVGTDGHIKAGKSLTSKIRQEDYIGTLEDGALHILLSNANSEDAAFVIGRIREEGYGCVLLEDLEL